MDSSDLWSKRKRALLVLKSLASSLKSDRKALVEIKKELDALDNFLLTKEWSAGKNE